MNYLLEDPTPALVAGAVVATLAAIVYSSLLTPASLAWLAGALLLTLVGVGVEWVVETPREQAGRTLLELLDAVERNDLPGVLERIAPTASAARADAQAILPLVVVDKANQLGSVDATLDDEASPTEARLRCRVLVKATLRKTGTPGGGATEVEFVFTRTGGEWLLVDYSASDEWRAKVGKLRSGP